VSGREVVFKKSSTEEPSKKGSENAEPKPSTLLDIYDRSIDNVLRPKYLTEFVGQPQLKERLSIVIGAAEEKVKKKEGK
jgi:hypothetical protein